MTPTRLTGEQGPVYSVPLIDLLPLNGGVMLQAMPDRDDLARARRHHERLVSAYEVLLARYLEMMRARGTPIE